VPGDLSDILRAHDARLEQAQLVSLKIVKGRARKHVATLLQIWRRALLLEFQYANDRIRDSVDHDVDDAADRNNFILSFFVRIPH
jgi:hypothetical protein